MNDSISRQAAIDEIMGQPSEVHYPSWYAEQIKALPPAQLEITDEQAINRLQESGWMQNHDRQMYEMGLRERLADDSGSYDALLPSAQPEREKGRWIMEGTELDRRLRCSRCSRLAIWAPYAMSFIFPNFCPNCGADMREAKK